MTRPIALFGLLLAALLGTSSVLAQTTQPAGGSRQRVLVMQFAPLDDSSARHAADVGAAIQRSLIADLGASRGVDALSPAAGPQVVAPSDAQGALQEARRLDVDIVVWGNFQVLDPELRITGQVIDVRHEQPPLARIRATGTMHDLFRIQDRLTIQVCRAINVPVPREVLSDARDSSRDAQPNNNDYGQPPQQMAPDQTPYQQQYQEPDNYSYSYPPYYGPATYSYDYPAYNYAPYYYPYYSYPYYYPSFGFFFSNGFHNHGHDDHHDGHDGHHDGHDGHHDSFSHGSHGSSGFHGSSMGGFHGSGTFHGSSGFHGSSMGGFHGGSMGGFHGGSMGGGFHGGGMMGGGGGHMGGGGGGHR